MIQTSSYITSVSSNTKILPGINTIMYSQDMNNNNTNKRKNLVSNINIYFNDYLKKKIFFIQQEPLASVQDAQLLLSIGSSTEKPKKLHPKFRPVNKI